MNILFISLSKFENLKEKQIYNDIFKELALRGHQINIVCPKAEAKTDNQFDNIKIFRTDIGEIRNTNKIVKGIKTITLEKKYWKTISKNINLANIDVVMYSTPPITFNNIIKKMKLINNRLISILILKDIFPQNAVDLGFFKKSSILFKYFKKREKKLYHSSDLIGCMSEANIDYVLNENKELNRSKFFLFKNSLYKNSLVYDSEEKEKIFSNFQLDKDKVTFVYGGNLGKPQYFKGIKYFIENFYRVKGAQLLIIGDGTEFNNLKKLIEDNKNTDIKIHKKISKLDFDKIMQYSDVGLIFLDPHFTIPNFPSRFSSYLDFEKPVLASTDKATDIGKVIEDNHVGFWNFASDHEKLIENANLIMDSDLRAEYSINAKKLFDKEYRIEVNIDTLLKEIDKYEKNI